MADERHLKELQRVAELLGLEDEVSQDTSEARLPCPLHEECVATGDNNLILVTQISAHVVLLALRRRVAVRLILGP
jgi:hypothetical protein